MGFALSLVRRRRRRRRRPRGFEWLVLLVWALNVRVVALYFPSLYAVGGLFWVVYLWMDRPWARGVGSILYAWIFGEPED